MICRDPAAVDMMRALIVWRGRCRECGLIPPAVDEMTLPQREELYRLYESLHNEPGGAA